MELKLVSHKVNQIFFFHLLIVPYGIETLLGNITLELTLAFNRTLWN